MARGHHYLLIPHLFLRWIKRCALPGPSPRVLSSLGICESSSRWPDNTREMEQGPSLRGAGYLL